MKISCTFAALSLVLSSAAIAQDRGLSIESETQQAAENVPVAPSSSTPVISQGRAANAGNGQVGQRQSRADAAPSALPLDRVQGRIASRVQNRLRNRIDRFYDPQANAMTPFLVAGDRIRTASAPRR